MKAFKHLVLVVLLALGACAYSAVEDFHSLPADQQVYVLKTDYQMQLDALKRYRDQPACSPTVVVGCYEPAIFVRLVEAAVSADFALDTAEAAVKGGAADSPEAIRAARAAVNAFINEMVAANLASGVK